MEYQFKEKYTVQDLLEIMRLLRSENGCPWDREQDHRSIRNDLLEETYEVLDAIDSGDRENLCEELGDLLLQVVFHSQIATEDGEFDFDEVADGICKKLIIRHPHVFGDVQVDGTEQVLTNWDAIKRRTKGQSTTTDAIDSIPKCFPALVRSRKVQKKAAKAGFDWDDVDGAIEKIHEETRELETAIRNNDEANTFEELGDLLFAVVNVSRFVHVDAEHSLAAATDKFADRFAKCEKLAAERGIDMQSASLEELDLLWEEVKRH